jgi:hypothetical protein
LRNATPAPHKLIQNRLANHSRPSDSPTRHTGRIGQFAPRATHGHRKSTHSAKRTEVVLTGEPCRLRASRRSVTLPSEKGHLSSSAASISSQPSPPIPRLPPPAEARSPRGGCFWKLCALGGSGWRWGSGVPWGVWVPVPKRASCCFGRRVGVRGVLGPEFQGRVELRMDETWYDKWDPSPQQNFPFLSVFCFMLFLSFRWLETYPWPYDRCPTDGCGVGRLKFPAYYLSEKKFPSYPTK